VRRERAKCLELKDTTILCDQFGLLASEVTRVAREVGTDGNWAAQAHVPDVAAREDLTDSVNRMGQQT